MIAVDTNILVSFQREEHPHHSQALSVLVALAEGTAPWAIPWACIHEFLAVVTHSRVFKHPTSTADAIDAVSAWLESPTLRMIGEGPGYWPVLRQQLQDGQIAGPRVHDARIAAICIQNGVREFWTADRDFSRFPRLKCRNPLIA